ncbi:AfsA-related hotdog domain-containing protein [Yinghuangia seranimata]|uniref:AfsA-related hotdog domain-containing protein n=1 Tax=Yinghuangia seranimata TaxID=408067 RepID=UPI00248C70E5|nr:AfsA-related hotdog domain-containing protein [Yinghuangia seranimata]MDI2127655.1 AfsA-related hotdog domain-containing protein [Yinghuangia seranimata]
MTTTDTAPQLTFSQTVPNAIAHRRAVGEVFVTDAAQVGEDEFLLAWQIPRAHALWGDRVVPFHDPFATAEAARQGSFVVLHRFVDIPLSLPFSLRTYGFQVTDLEAFRDNARSPLEGLLRYRLVDKKFADGELGSLGLVGELEVGGVTAMTINGDVAFMSRDDYLALRRFQRSRKPLADAPPPVPRSGVDPRLVGRRDVRNIVVAEPEAGRYPLVIDRGHPSYFDHDYDHVPGPFIVEGFRQAAILESCRTGALSAPEVALTACETGFADFGEFETDLDYTARVVGEPDPGVLPGSVQVEVAVTQFGKELATGRVTLTPYPA